METFTQKYQMLIKNIVEHGFTKTDHRGPTKMLPAVTMVINELEYGQFPMNTLRKNHIGACIREFDAFSKGIFNPDVLEGDYNLGYIWEREIGIARKENRDLKLGYYKDFKSQMDYILKKYDKDNYSRKLIMTNGAHYVPQDLSCCWSQIQFLKIEDKVNIILKLNSTDAWLGLVADIAIAGVMLRLFCNHVGAKPGKIYAQFGDVHLYQRHINANYFNFVNDKILYQSPAYTLNCKDIFEFEYDDFKLDNYQYNDNYKYDNKLITCKEDNV